MGIIERFGLSANATWAPTLNPADWAELKMWLSSAYSENPGPFRVDRLPYMRGPLDAFVSPNVDKITLVFASQCGKSTLMEIMVLWTMDSEPRPAMWVFSEEVSRNAYVDQRIKKTIEASPLLLAGMPRGIIGVNHEKADFFGAPLYFAVAQSEGQLASRPCALVLADEIDKFPSETANEGSPLRQAEARLRTFSNTKFVQSSTPTAFRGNVWREYLESDRREWLVPCPGCGERIAWDTRDVRWQERPAEFSHGDWARRVEDGVVDVWWECPRCGNQARGDDQNTMNRAGAWEAKRPGGRHAGFHLPALATPWTKSTFRAQAGKWLRACEAQDRGDESPVRMFFLHERAEPWEPKARGTDSADLVAHAGGPPRGVCPAECPVVTVGVDVQHEGLYWCALAQDRAGTRVHLVDHGRIDSGDLGFLAHDVLERRWAVAGSASDVLASAVFVDSGEGLRTLEVYRFCQRFTNAFPSKGSSKALAKGALVVRNADKTQKHAGRLWLFDTLQAKDRWAELVKADWFTAHEEVVDDHEFRSQMESERRVRAGQGGRWELRPGHKANHYFDAAVMALAGGEAWRLSRKTPSRPIVAVGDQWMNRRAHR